MSKPWNFPKLKPDYVAKEIVKIIDIPSITNVSLEVKPNGHTKENI